MIVLLFTTLFLSTFRNTRAEISSEWQVPGQSLDEAADEMHDAEILRAVVTSMEEWGKKHNRTRIKRAQSRSVCYDHLGCFEDSGPFGYLEMLPSPPQEINTRFLLYSTRSRGDIPLLDVPFGNMSTAWSWADRAFNSSIPTKVIVHGFGSNCDHVWVYEMRSALMAVEECNVICVDWEAGAIIPNYVRAAANTRLVGKQLAMLLEGLASHINLKFDKVHLIGFSLGAHVAGFAGSQLQNISRITGLDPAGPLFEAQDPRARLDSSDAMFVDVIHSNGENLILGGLGSWQPMGHVDFYPNGGRMQTGCSNLFVGAVTDIIWSSAIEGRSLCNHRRAYKFFTDSVSPKCHFPSFPCETYDDFLAGRCFGCNGDKRCGNMGYYADRSTGRGQLYLLTRDEEPFCAHQYHVKVESSRGNQSVVSYGRILLALVGDSGLNETFPMTRKDDAELTVGGMLSRMLVPHPALGVPIKVQLIYQAYSGWISSGLNRWTIDKVLLSDSFGKTSSICKKGLVLNSGSPVVLPLYPGDCNHPVEKTDDIKNPATDMTDTENKIAEENVTSHKPSFIPTQVVQIGDEIIGNNKSDYQSDNIASPSIKREDAYAAVSIEKKIIHKDAHIKSNHKLKSFHSSETVKNRPSPEPNVIPMGKHFRIDAENNTSDPLLSIFDATDILNLPWQPLLANSLDNTPNERESGRAFGSINTKFTAFPFFENSFTQNINATSEIVEPILKAPSSKNARSHDISKIKSEITEPILGSTTVKTETNILKISKPTQVRTNRAPKYFENTSTAPSISETSINQSHWVPSYNLLPPQSEAKNIWDQINNKTSNTNNRTSKSNHFNDSDANSSNDETFSLFQWQGREKKEVIEEKNKSGNSFTIQFLPSRLVSFLEKAERYARNTLLPLVSAYTPKFLMFGQDMSTSEPSKKVKHKFVPLEEVPLESKNIPIPEQTQEEKINLVKNIKPPNTNESGSEKIAERISTSTVISKDEQTSTDSTSIEDNQNLENDVIKIVKAPDMTTTTLAPITMQSPLNSSEKIIIVYPSNTRDDRKIQSHTYPEIMQFESVYQQSLQNSRSNAMLKNRPDLQSSRQYDSTNINLGIHIDLPTYEPPLSTSPYPYVRSFSTVPQFIPVSYSTESQTISNIERSQET